MNTMTREQHLQLHFLIGKGMLQRLLNQGHIDEDEFKLMVKEYRKEFTKIHNAEYGPVE